MTFKDAAPGFWYLYLLKPRDTLSLDLSSYSHMLVRSWENPSVIVKEKCQHIHGTGATMIMDTSDRLRYLEKEVLTLSTDVAD